MAEQDKLRVAIVGCGQFSRAHVSALQDIQGLGIVGTCDRDRWRAEDLAHAAKTAHPYSDLSEMIDNEHPQVVHILTPPTSHANLAIQAMQAGCHVLVEKPMALSVQEADDMIAAAKENGVKLGTNHNYLYNPCILKARQLVEHGDIGEVVFVEGYYGISEAGGSYASITGRSHWAWRLPGNAFTNFLPHLIYLQFAFLDGDVSVAGVTLGRGEQPDDPPTELSVLLQGCRASGTMIVSMRTKPYAKFIDIYGTRGIIHADLATEVCTLHKVWRAPGMVSKVLFNFEESAQLATETFANTAKVGLGVMKKNPGLYGHLKAFYSALQSGKELPVPGEDGRKMIEIMQATWERAPELVSKSEAIQAKTSIVSPQTEAERRFSEAGIQGKVLVTGATGFLGYHLVETLARCGVHARALVRDQGRVSQKIQEQAEIVCGDLRDPASIEAAMRDVTIVYHCAAVTNNNISWKTHFETNVQGTENVLKAAQKTGVKQVVHMSSVIVYGLSNPDHNDSINEDSPYASKPDQWAYYMRSKMEADQLAKKYIDEFGLPVTVLRLGILYGPGGDRAVGRGLLQLGSLKFIIGSGKNRLPYTYIRNVVDSVLLASITPEAIGQIYNIVDGTQVKVRDLMKKNMKITGERAILISVPSPLLLGGCSFLEWRAGKNADRIPPKLSSYVINSVCRNLTYDVTKAKEQLGWQSPVTLEEALKKTYEAQA
jgi:2-alkyl-3-oxoalkanoate reductase